MVLLCMPSRVIGSRLSPSGKSHGFPGVAVGTWGIFSSFGGDCHSILCLFRDVRTTV